MKGFLIATIVFFIALAWFGNRSIYFPMKYPAGDWNLQSGSGVSDVWMETTDKVRVHGWYSAARPGRVALFLHGNAGNVTHRMDKIKRLTAAGIGVLVLDWRGYGRSEGWPTESGLRKDARAAYEHLRRSGFGGDQIVLYGESLGTTVATLLAAEVQCAGLVLEAPFPNVQSVAGKVLPVLGPLLVRGYDAGSVISRIKAPKLFIHGDRDEVIDLELGRRLYTKAAQPKEFWLVKGAGHNDIAEVAGDQYTEKLREFAVRIWGQ
jgi:fermentation-respiration switch protein FrsA (DUF1100 family)